MGITRVGTWVIGFLTYLLSPPEPQSIGTVENQMDKNMGNDMEIGIM